MYLVCEDGPDWLKTHEMAENLWFLHYFSIRWSFSEAEPDQIGVDISRRRHMIDMCEN